jgi:hypothetical protein
VITAEACVHSKDCSIPATASSWSRHTQSAVPMNVHLTPLANYVSTPSLLFSRPHSFSVYISNYICSPMTVSSSLDVFREGMGPFSVRCLPMKVVDHDHEGTEGCRGSPFEITELEYSCRGEPAQDFGGNCTRCGLT